MLHGRSTCRLAAWLILWSGLISGCALPPPAEPGLPNVVVIVADDVGWKDLSSYGNPNLRTPHIDRLAAEGVRFERAFVAAPSCSSSRAAMMTGQYPHTNGVTGLGGVATDLRPAFPL